MLPLHNQDNYREKLRRERQTEYQEYLKQKEGVKHQQMYENNGNTSVQEKRRQLAEERENELSRQSSRNSDSRRYRSYNSVDTLNMHERKDPYNELRDRKRYEQKRYLMDDDDDDGREFYQRKLNMRQIDPVYRLEEERFMEELNNNRGRRRRQRQFDNDLERKVHFDDIEDYDSSIMRRYRQNDQQDTRHDKDHNSQGRNDEFSTRSRRSNSAPLVTKGLMMLGGEESVDAQKKKKQQYAEELRQQIQQKEKEKKLEKLERFGFKIDSKEDHTSQHSAQDSSDKENHVPPPQQRSSHHLSPPKLKRHSRDYLPESFYQGRPPLPLDYYDYYKPYPPAAQYYPPMFTPYYPPDGHDYPLYHPMEHQSRRSRVSYDGQYDDPVHHSRQQPPLQVNVIDHDQHKMADQPKHDERSPESKAAYRDILHKQMEEKRAKDERAKLEQDRYDEKLRREIQEYDPWGKGGGGAPNQDNRGNIITDLRRMRKENETNMLSGSPSTSPRSANFVTVDYPNTTAGQRDSPNNRVGQRPVSEGRSQPQPNQSSQEAYKDALQQQIAEKERAKQLEKEKQRIEEEKELLRLEKQRIKLQEEYEKELAQQKAKEEDARRKNEAMKREAEEKRMAALRRREEEELKEIKRRAPQKPPTPTPVVAPVEFRSNSPPVPALQNKMVNKLQDNSFGHQLTVAPAAPSSPPVPALRNKLHNVPTDATQHQHVESQSSYVNVSKGADERVDVLRQLSRMRQEFENEQKKIHRQLSGNSTTSTTVAVKPRRIAKDVFQKKPSAPLPSASNTRSVQDVSEQFNDLKYKRTSSRLSFMKKYPAPPKSESSLDIQQDALLRYQERDLAKLRSDNSEHSLNNNIPLGSSNLLASHEQHSKKSMFGDKSLLGSVTPLAQSKLQQPNEKVERPPSHAGGLSLSSVATLEVENIAARNEERMKRLDAILNSSKTDNSDPEAVIRKFLENRDHSVLLPAQKRRASEVSLDADTRMCPVHDSHE